MNTKQILDIMKVVSWVIFIGLCIKTGAILISFLVSLISESGTANNVYLGLDLSGLKDLSERYYMYVVSFLIAIVALKAYLFYLVIKIFSEINLEAPFSSTIGRLILKISYYSLVIGAISIIAARYSKWLYKKGAAFDIEWAGAEFIFMAAILFTISLVFKRGLEIQEENELTI